jgi:hypothetical protein
MERRQDEVAHDGVSSRKPTPNVVGDWATLSTVAWPDHSGFGFPHVVVDIVLPDSQHHCVPFRTQANALPITAG